jgi:hypothetical protein
VYNATGSAIGANSWVRLSGAVTQNSVPYIQLADATSAANSIVEGFVKVGIANGAYGFLYTKGVVSDMDASSFGNNGQIIFLSTTPGRASNVAPTGANSVYQVAKILSNGSANGKIQIDISARQAYGKTNGSILFANNNLIQASDHLIFDESNNRLQVANTANASVTKISYAVSWVNFTPTFPNGTAGDKKGMMFLDSGNLLGGGVSMYWCDADYTTGAVKIWWRGVNSSGAWV